MLLVNANKCNALCSINFSCFFFGPHVFPDSISYIFCPGYLSFWQIPAGICLLKVNNKNTRTECEICSELTVKTPERRQWIPSGVYIVNFEHILYFALVFLLLILNM